jgi:glucosamine--fructose-6-phosphate aminotransferase (isomerizing)
MLRQLEALAADVRTLTGDLADGARAALEVVSNPRLERAVLVGAGDSFHVSSAAQMAFESFAGMACQSLSPAAFTDYHLPGMEERVAARTMVLVTSASGSTPAAIEAVERARDRGAATLAVTCTPGSRLTGIVDATLPVDVPRRHRSPGIRSFQGALLALLLVAIGVGEGRNRISSAEANGLRAEFGPLADAIEATAGILADACPVAVDAFEELERMLMLGSGPSLGAARFAAAKSVEAAGCFAVGQELEEWWHVERFAYPIEMPIFVVAPPGRSHHRAVQRAALAHRAGRHVVAVADTEDTAFAHTAAFVLPVRGRVREEFSALLYHLYGGYVAFGLAARLGRFPFQGDLESAPVPMG